MKRFVKIAFLCALYFLCSCENQFNYETSETALLVGEWVCIDSDDMVEDNYLKVMYEYCADMTHEIVESTIVIKDQIAKYDPKLIRCGVAGSALQTKIIGNIRFDESLQIGEDTKFMHDVIDLTKYRKRHAPTKYFYQLGINNNSLTMLHSRKEIRKER